MDYATSLLAAHGYVVAAANFPATNTYAKGGAWLADVVNQPGDVRFVIDQVLAFNREPGHPLFGRIDEDRIGVMGLSLGGLTTHLVSFDPARDDPRIKAAVSIAGFRQMLTPKLYHTRSLPFLEIGATDDNVVPYNDNAATVPRDVPGALLVTLAHGTHTGFATQASYIRFLSDLDKVACWFIRRNTLPPGQGPGWREGFGDQQGYVQDIVVHNCSERSNLNEMDPRLQHRLTALALSAFFDSNFAADESARRDAAIYLRQGLAKEFSEVSVSQADMPSGEAPHGP
jgi:predicted dienelactone hydrolase